MLLEHTQTLMAFRPIQDNLVVHPHRGRHGLRDVRAVRRANVPEEPLDLEHRKATRGYDQSDVYD